jgi:hypothetical protein
MNEEPAYWDEVLGSMPEATLAVRRAAFRELLSGRPALIETVADEAGLSADAARDAIDLVVSVGMAEADDGTIVGMDGLTTRRTRHSLVLDGVELWTWCAYDIVGIGAALGAEAVGENAVRRVRAADRGPHPGGPARGDLGGGVAARRILRERHGGVLSQRAAVLLAGAPRRVEGGARHDIWRRLGHRGPRRARSELLAPARSVKGQASRSAARS